MIENREEIVKSGGVAIAFIEKQLVYPPRNQIDNYIIIPIVSGVFLLLIVINLIFKVKR